MPFSSKSSKTSSHVLHAKCPGCTLWLHCGQPQGAGSNCRAISFNRAISSLLNLLDIVFSPLPPCRGYLTAGSFCATIAHACRDSVWRASGGKGSHALPRLGRLFFEASKIYCNLIAVSQLFRNYSCDTTHRKTPQCRRLQLRQHRPVATPDCATHPPALRPPALPHAATIR